MGIELNYYGGGNTGKGFVQFFESNFQDLDRLFILKGGPGTGKSTLIRAVGNEFKNRGFNLEWIHCSADVGSLDGVIIPALKAGIVDGTKPHVIEPQIAGAVDEYVNLGVAWDRKKLVPRKEEIIDIQTKIEEAYKRAYQSLGEALRRHDDLENIYIPHIDFRKAEELTHRLITNLFQEESKQGKSVAKHRFMGATTPDGPRDFLENLTENVSKRYFIKGRAGSGKSTLLRKILKQALTLGYDTEIYHCGFDPDSLDMIIVRELDFAIFDSTAPHEYFPSRNGDEIIDLYKETMDQDTDEKYAEEIQAATKHYKEKVQEGLRHLKETKHLRNQLEAIYKDAMDFSKVDVIKKEIIRELEQMEKEL